MNYRLQFEESWKYQNTITVSTLDQESVKHAVQQVKSTGGIIQLAAGRYIFSESLLLPSNVWIKGQGEDKTFIELNPHTGRHVFTNADYQNGNANIAVSDLTIIGNGEFQEKQPGETGVAFCCGGYFKKLNGGYFFNLRTLDMRQTGLHFTVCDHIRVDHLYSEKLGWSGISTSGTNDICVQNVVVTDSGRDKMHSGIHFDGGTGIFAAVKVSNTTGNGLMLDSKFTPLKHAFVDSTCETCKRGVSLSGDHDNLLSDVVVHGNYSNNREVGVLVSNSNNVFITNTTAKNNDLAAIVLQGEKGANNVTIVNCELDEEVKIGESSTEVYAFSNKYESSGHTSQSKPAAVGLPKKSEPKKNLPVVGIEKKKNKSTLKSLIRNLVPVPLLNRLNLSKYSAIITESKLFDEDWYLKTYPDVAKSGMDPIKHFILHGVSEFRDPSPAFHTQAYLKRNPDVAREKINPFVHYILHGRYERADSFQTSDRQTATPDKVAEPTSAKLTTPTKQVQAKTDAAAVDISMLSPEEYYTGYCSVCGYEGLFIKNHKSMREGFRCPKCKGSLRQREQARAIVREFSKSGSKNFAELVKEPHFKDLKIYEPGIVGPFIKHLSSNCHYTESYYWENAKKGDVVNGVEFQDLMSLTYDNGSFDLVITCEVFEHIRKPYVAFAEIYRVLKAGGAHIFTVPAQEPMPEKTIYRVDTSGDQDVDILPPYYHIAGDGSKSLVYTEYGMDLIDELAKIGFSTEIMHPETQNQDVNKAITFISRKK